MLGYGARFLGVGPVIQTDRIDASEINWGKQTKRGDSLVRGFKISVGFLLNRKLTLLVKAVNPCVRLGQGSGKFSPLLDFVTIILDHWIA